MSPDTASPIDVEGTADGVPDRKDNVDGINEGTEDGNGDSAVVAKDVGLDEAPRVCDDDRTEGYPDCLVLRTTSEGSSEGFPNFIADGCGERPNKGIGEGLSTLLPDSAAPDDGEGSADRLPDGNETVCRRSEGANDGNTDCVVDVPNEPTLLGCNDGRDEGNAERSVLGSSEC